MAEGIAHHLMLGVEAWCCWEPLKDNSVCTSYSAGKTDQEVLAGPQLHSVPPMQRRRLSPMARVAFHVLSHCRVPEGSEPLVFSSVMGEIRRTQNILDALAADQAVSPAAFSLSVHNSVAGLWSLIQGNKAPMLSLAPADGCPVPALLEAAGILAEGHYQSVLVVYCEEDYPDFYRPFISSPVAPTAVALRLVPAGKQPGSLVLSVERAASEVSGDVKDNARSLVNLLQQRVRRVTVVEPQARWQLAVAR